MLAWDDCVPALPGWAYADLRHPAPLGLLVMRPDGLALIDANAAYATAVALDRREIFARSAFRMAHNARLDPPGERTVVERRSQSGHVLRGDTPVPPEFVARDWGMTELPLLGPSGDVEYLLHRVSDLAGLCRALVSAPGRSAARRLRPRPDLVDLAVDFYRTETFADVEDVVAARGADIVRTTGGALLVVQDDGGWHLTVTRSPTRRTRVGRPGPTSHGSLPARRVVRSGRVLVLPDLRSVLAFDPLLARLSKASGAQAWVFVPLLVNGRARGALGVGWADERVVPAGDLAELEAFAAPCAQAVHRVAAARRERLAVP